MPRWVFFLGSLLPLLAVAGCSRLHFRERADREVTGVLSQKDISPQWKIENWHVYPDGRARFADGSCPDNPPYPPDDYPAWLLSPNPQRPNRKSGTGNPEGTEYLQWIEKWDAENRAAEEQAKEPVTDAAPQQPLGSLPYLAALETTQKPFRITLDQSVELALFNSREFQDRREDLYLAALPVTEQRFSFAAQAFASSQAIREIGGDANSIPGNRWRIDTEAGVSRLFPTGGTLLFRFANQVVLDLTGSRPDISFSNMTLTLLQPLLAGGGYAVTLEPLTQSERSLLYALRSYARFRKIFYSAIAVATDYTNSPYGLAGLSTNLGRGIGTNLTAPSVGYLPTLLRAATLTNERRNIDALENNLKLITNLMEGGNSTQLQVIQAEQQLLQSRSDFLVSTRTYQDQLDNFKLQLGVPTTLPIELDDAPLRPMRQQLRNFDRLYDQLTSFQQAAATFDANDTEETVRSRWLNLLTASPLAKGTPFAQEYPAASEGLRKLTTAELLQKRRGFEAERQKMLDARADRQLKAQPDSPQDLANLSLIETAIDFIRFEEAIREYLKKPWLRFPAERRAIEQANAYRGVADTGTLLGLRTRNQRNDTIHEAWPDVPAIALDGKDLLEIPLDEAATQAAQTALNLRLDLMNARAQLVDAYRQIAVRANALQGIFDVRYDFETNNNGSGGPLGGSANRNAVTLRFEPPLVRRVERNLYRASLVAYQRQRRFLMAVEDNIVNEVRADVRAVRASSQTYILQQRAVELAYAQVDSARSTLVAPPDPAARETAGNVAALTDQLLRAQAQLLRSQNALYTVWVAYQTARTNLYLDLELLPLDARGLWTDDPAAKPHDTPPAAVQP